MNKHILTTILFWFLIAGVIGCMPPSWGSRALLYPKRHAVDQSPGQSYEDVRIISDGAIIKGWLFHSKGPTRATLIYLHGSSDNRTSGLPIAEYYQQKGLDVLIYDSRAHGESTGDFCTYGYYEKRDLQRIIDGIGNHPIILIGSSLGAAVSLQAAGEDERIKSVISVATFADLRSVIEERAPFFAGRKNIEDAIAIAEHTARFNIADVSPVSSAPGIKASVLMIHGEKDSETSVSHSRKVYDALTGRKRLIIVPDAGHNNAITPEVWEEIDLWIETLLDGNVNVRER